MIQRNGEWWVEARPISESSRKFDLAFWRSQSPEAIFQAAWEMVELSAKVKGQSQDELRLQRSLGVIKPIRG